MKKKRQYLYGLVAFVIPVLIMMFLFWRWKIYPGGPRTMLSGDEGTQFVVFYKAFHDVLTGDASGFYSWNAGMGLNFYALISYYLGGFLTPLIFFFSKDAMPLALYFLTLLKIGLASTAFWVYAKERFKLKMPINVALATAYGLMSFTLAHSEMIMWMDAFIYFPLIILGIDRLLEQRKPKCLFFSYLMLFLTNYYFGFMIGIFSVLYFLVRYVLDFKTYKARLIPYGITSLSAGLGSLVMIWPMLMDLHYNGQPLSPISSLFVKGSNPFMPFLRQVLGSYDTTKYNADPYIYIGLIPFIFMLYYFFNKHIERKYKIGFGLLGLFVLLSFYLEPLNLAWQGFHAPVFFPFRFSFVFSFFTIMLAGYAMEHVEKEDIRTIVGLTAGVFFVMTIGIIIESDKNYHWMPVVLLSFTFLFIVAYLLLFVMTSKHRITAKWMTIGLSVTMIGETFINAHYVMNRMHHEWPYIKVGTFYSHDKDIKKLIGDTQEANGDNFYRTEYICPGEYSNNDSFKYGFSSVHMFSSVRNVPMSRAMDRLGYRNPQHNGLVMDYKNNTMLMDSLVGVRFNISEEPLQKYGFKKVDKAGDLTLYENQYVLPTGVQTDASIKALNLPQNATVIERQQAFVNALLGEDIPLYTMIKPKVTSIENAAYKKKSGHKELWLTQNCSDKGEVNYKVTIPAGSQAYLVVHSVNPQGGAFYPQVEVTSPKVTNEFTNLRLVGEFYNLGQYKKEKTIKIRLRGKNELMKLNPPMVMVINNDAYKQAMEKLQSRGVDFHMKGNQATATVNTDKATRIFTTIPYDRGWTLKIDGKTQKIQSAVNGGFISFNVPKGKHHIKLTFVPLGLKVGIMVSIMGLLMFGLFDLWYERRRKKQQI